MARGRHHVPTAILKARGTVKAKYRNEEEPVVETHLPDCPKWMSLHAKKEWAYLAPKLYDISVLTEIDKGALAILCQSWADYVEAAEQMAGKGKKLIVTPNGLRQKHPYENIKNEAFSRWFKMAQEFGLTPAARTKIHVNVEQKNKTSLKDAFLDAAM